MVYNTVMIARQTDVACVRAALKRSRVVALLGPRQCGKTTLARQLCRRIRSTTSISKTRRDSPVSARRTSPYGRSRACWSSTKSSAGPTCSRCCGSWPTAGPCPARFLIFGSASPDRLKQSSESLRGAPGDGAFGGLPLGGPGCGAQGRHWLRGGFPLSYTARTQSGSLVWRRQFLQTFVERDVPQLGITIPAVALHRFWNMIAHYHGQTWNAAEFGAPWP